MARYKVRLDDGSEIVLELQAVKDWYTQGLLTRDSPVLKPGSSQWLPLVRALNLVSAPPAASATSAPPRSTAAPRSRPRSALQGGLAQRLVLVALGAGGVAVGAWRLWPAAPAAPAPPAVADAKHSLDQLRGESVAAVLRDVPLFSEATVDRLVRLSEAQALSPEEAFRRGFRYAALGVSSLPPADARELASLTAAAYARVSARERAQIGSYLEKLKGNRLTTPKEDRDAVAIMKRALQGFPAARLARVQALYGRAVEAGLARG